MCCLYLDLKDIKNLNEVLEEFDELQDYFTSLTMTFGGLIQAEVKQKMSALLNQNIDHVPISECCDESVA